MGADLVGAKNVKCPACGQHQPYWTAGDKHCERCGRLMAIRVDTVVYLVPDSVDITRNAAILVQPGEWIQFEFRSGETGDSDRTRYGLRVDLQDKDGIAAGVRRLHATVTKSMDCEQLPVWERGEKIAGY